MYTDEVIKKKQGKKSKWSYNLGRFHEVNDSGAHLLDSAEFFPCSLWTISMLEFLNRASWIIKFQITAFFCFHMIGMYHLEFIFVETFFIYLIRLLDLWLIGYFRMSHGQWGWGPSDHLLLCSLLLTVEILLYDSFWILPLVFIFILSMKF
jgi:hypothetical protein